MFKRRGRVHWMILVGIAAALVVAGLLIFQGDSPVSGASRFMAALAKGDAKILAETSILEGKSLEEIEKEWQRTLDGPGKHYRFRYRIFGDIEADQKVASVRMQVWRNYDPGFSYEENFNLPMEKDKDGRWKVKVVNVSRKMYPGLPR